MQIIGLCDALGEAMDTAFVGQWLDQPNEMLDNLKPAEAIERGKIDLVWQVAEVSGLDLSFDMVIALPRALTA